MDKNSLILFGTHDQFILFSRRMAYSPLPLAAVVIHISLISFKLSGPAGAKVLAAIFINLLLFKVVIHFNTFKVS